MDIVHYNGALAILRAAREHTTYRANGWMGGERTEITFFHHFPLRWVGTIRTKIHDMPRPPFSPTKWSVTGSVAHY